MAAPQLVSNNIPYYTIIDVNQYLQGIFFIFHGSLTLGAPSPLNTVFTNSQLRQREQIIHRAFSEGECRQLTDSDFDNFQTLLSKWVREFLQGLAQQQLMPNQQDAEQQSWGRKLHYYSKSGHSLLIEELYFNFVDRFQNSTTNLAQEHAYNHQRQRDFIMSPDQYGGHNFYFYVSFQSQFSYEIYITEYKRIKMLGRGGYGEVLLAKHQLTNELVAIKKIHLDSRLPANQIESLFLESRTLERLKHPNIIQLQNVFTVKNYLLLMLEYLEGGDLQRYLDTKLARYNIDSASTQLPSGLTECEVRTILQQLCKTISFCHGNSIVHRDIKPQNILLPNSEQINGIKLIDFGLSVQVQGYISRKSDKNQSGTLVYMPPEVLSGVDKRTTPMIDVWSIGVVAYQLVMGRLPFDCPQNNLEEIARQIVEDDVKFTHTGNDQMRDLILQMLNKNPQMRVKMHQIMQSRWLFPPKDEIGCNSVVQVQQAEVQQSVISIDMVDNEESMKAIFKRYELDFKPSFLPLVKKYVEQQKNEYQIDLDGLMQCIKKSIEVLANLSKASNFPSPVKQQTKMRAGQKSRKTSFQEPKRDLNPTKAGKANEIPSEDGFDTFIKQQGHYHRSRVLIGIRNGGVLESISRIGGSFKKIHRASILNELQNTSRENKSYSPNKPQNSIINGYELQAVVSQQRESKDLAKFQNPARKLSNIPDKFRVIGSGPTINMKVIKQQLGASPDPSPIIHNKPLKEPPQFNIVRKEPSAIKNTFKTYPLEQAALKQAAEKQQQDLKQFQNSQLTNYDLYLQRSRQSMAMIINTQKRGSSFKKHDRSEFFKSRNNNAAQQNNSSQGSGNNIPVAQGRPRGASWYMTINDETAATVQEMPKQPIQKSPDLHMKKQHRKLSFV
ncbi:hypothetical protein FGO68_gene15512 [Halteria grandinella]|uniref:Protein kinase domain-containing protein n=1 Tax=Halteria grandinella TaxID=5974 RepID=A0A8J8P038_HALGN|nr:hypothetical protein FGO68_gene15512 [Halteria grandinella]